MLEKSYIGSGAAGRNTTILRSNYKTPEGARFYDASVKLYEGLGAELDFNLLFTQCGHLTLAHTDRAMFVMANRAEVNRLHGIDSRLIGPDEVRSWRRRCTSAGRHLSDPWARSTTRRAGSSATTRWSGARARRRQGGAEIHPYTEVTGIERRNGRVTGVKTNRGTIKAGHGAQLHGGLEHADLRHGRRARCRSPPTSCRRA